MSENKLNQISAAVRGLRDYRKELRIEADDWIRQQVMEREAMIDRLVVEALDDGFKIIEVAEAYTVSGRTPNRNAIHAIRKRSTRPSVENVGIFPFRWEEREVLTVSGNRQVWDVVVDLESFGPQFLSGHFEWRYDNGTLEEVVRADKDPYPNSKYYQSVLDAWLKKNPYPGEE